MSMNKKSNPYFVLITLDNASSIPLQMRNDGWLRLYYGIAFFITFFQMSFASDTNEESSPESVKLQYGEATTDYVESSYFLALQYVKASRRFTPERKTFDVGQFLGMEDVLILDKLLGDFVPSTRFPANPADCNDSATLFQAHKNILRFALYYADDLLMNRLAEKFFGFIHPETRDDFLRFVYNCKENDEESTHVLRVFFLKQAEMVRNLSPYGQGLFLRTFSGLVPAVVEIFMQLTPQNVECTRLGQYESEWRLDGHVFILGNGFSQEEWKFETKKGNPHLEIALHLIQHDFSPSVSKASSFIQLLSSLRREFDENTVTHHISKAVQFALEMDLFDLIVEWLEIIKSHEISLYSIAADLMEIGLQKSNEEITRFASETARNEKVISNRYGFFYDPISSAIRHNTSIEVFEALFPLPQQLMKPRNGTSHLEAAIEAGRSDIAISLLAKDADPNQKCKSQSIQLSLLINTKNGEQPSVLTLAIHMGLHDVVRELLLRRAIVNEIDFKVSFDNIEMLEILFNSLFDEIQSIWGTLLKSAALSGHLEAVLFLESKGKEFSLISDVLAVSSKSCCCMSYWAYYVMNKPLY